jgi:dTDP-4-amino-4,6-dideoxygalactose transaminase
MNIPYNIPYISEETKHAAIDALNSNLLCGNKMYSKQVQESLCEMFVARHSLFVTSCSHALELALLTLKIQHDDEVLLPSFTFSSCANAIVLRGARPVFADIDPHTFNISLTEIEKKITPRTKVIMPVHYAGISCQMDEILALAKKHNIYVVEDAAQGVDAMYKNKYLGTLGDIGCYSFHETKNIVCGEGGAMVTNNKEFALRAEIIREKGTNRAAFFRGEVDKYTWVDIGSSYVQSDILASILQQQLNMKDYIRVQRERIFLRYMEEFKLLAQQELIQLPLIPEYARSNYHIFYVVVQNEHIRNEMLGALKAKGIGAVFHYIPLHSSPFGQAFGYREGDLPITENMSSRLIRLPIYPQLSEMEQMYVVENFKNIIVRTT